MKSAKEIYEQKLNTLSKQIASVEQLLSLSHLSSISQASTNAALEELRAALSIRRERLIELWQRYLHIASVELNAIRREYANDRWLVSELPLENRSARTIVGLHSLLLIAQACNKPLPFVRHYHNHILDRTLTQQMYFTFDPFFDDFWFRCPKCHTATHHDEYLKECVVQCAFCKLEAVISDNHIYKFIQCRVECEDCGQIDNYSYENDRGYTRCIECQGVCIIVPNSTYYQDRFLKYVGPLETTRIVDYLRDKGSLVAVDSSNNSLMRIKLGDNASIRELIELLHESLGYEQSEYSVKVLNLSTLK